MKINDPPKPTPPSTKHASRFTRKIADIWEGVTRLLAQGCPSPSVRYADRITDLDTVESCLADNSVLAV
jgi:hypothetical protein